MSIQLVTLDGELAVVVVHLTLHYFRNFGVRLTESRASVVALSTVKDDFAILWKRLKFGYLQNRDP
jgi:hypothetical protein